MRRKNLKKYIIFLIITALIIQSFVYQKPERASATSTGKVTVQSLNVRTGPSSSKNQLKSDGKFVNLTKGQKVTIISTSGSFYYVSFVFSGKTLKGYVHKGYISLSQTPTKTPTKKPTPTPIKKPTPTPVNFVNKGLDVKASVATSRLYMRSGPSTKYNKVGELKNKETITVQGDTTTNNEKWYGISVKKNNKTLNGFVIGEYIKLTYNKAINAQTLSNSVSVYTKAGSTSSYLKNKKGTKVTLSKGKTISVKNETTVKGVKWFQVSFSVNGETFTGYVDANKAILKSIASTPTPTKKPTPTPTKKPTPIPTAKPTPVPTAKPTPTNSGGTIKIPTIGTAFDVSNLKIFDSITNSTQGYICNTNYVFNVFNYSSSSNTLSLLTDNGKPILLKSAQPVTVTQSVILNYIPYYKINFTYEGIQKTGYVMPSIVYMPSKNPPVPTPTNAASVTPTKQPSVTPTPGGLNNTDFEKAMSQEGFPESYKVYLRMLHNQYPQWVFKAYHTGLDWNKVITAENKVGLNLIPNYKGIEWLSMDGSAYDWKTDKFTVYDGTTWVTASKEGLGYYMDPRNFLTTNGIFQFEMLRYQSAYQNINGVNNILNKTVFDGSYNFTNNYGIKKTYSYANTFMEAALFSGVSPYHLASRSKQEVLGSASSFSGSASGKYPDYEGYFNFYNIGASNSAGGGAIAKGLSYAKNGTTSSVNNAQYMLPWNNQYKAIAGGAFWIGSRYINRGQDTVYLQKFNVTDISTYSHQYMGNVEAPYAEAKKVKIAYDSVLNTPIVFSIPVYLNMPTKPVPTPAPKLNPNNWIKSLNVKDLNGTIIKLTPTFSQTVKNYDLEVDNKVDKITVAAAAVSTKAKVSGTGTIQLQVGTNKVTVKITAENGAVETYTLTVVRKK